MSSSKNILLLIPELGKGGAERTLSKLSCALSEHHNVHVCSFHPDGEVVYELGGVTHSLHPDLAKGFFGKLLRWRSRKQRLARLKQSLNIDVTISFLEGANYLNCLTAGGTRLLSIRGSKLHDEEISGVSGWVRKKILIPRLYRRADKIVCASHGLAREMKEGFGIQEESLKVIHNFYEYNEIQRLASQGVQDADWIENSTVIISCGRLHFCKEYKGLIRVMSGVRKEIECSLVLCGEGSQLQELVQYAKGLGLTVSEDIAEQADVVFAGYQANPFSIISKANLFVLSSSWEGFPNALAEAMICGTSVISTDCPTGPSEILDKPTEVLNYPIRTQFGVLMPLVNTSKHDAIWRKEIISALDNPNKEQVVRAQERMKEFDPKSIVSQWNKVIEAT